MAESTHTPGPWQIATQPYWDGSPEPIKITGKHKWPIAEICNRGTLAEEMNNARLLAAAPEMYAALTYIMSGDEDWDCETARDEARHAIAKAKGER